MPGSIDTQILNRAAFEFLSLLVVTSVKGSLVCLVVFFVTRTAKRLSPELRHLLWIFSLLCFVLIPFFSLVTPDLPVATLSVREEHAEAYKTAASLLSRRENEAEAAVRTGAPSSFSSRARGLEAPEGPRWPFLALSLWSAGLAFFTSRIVVGKRALCRLAAGVRRARDPRIYAVLAEASENLGIRRKVVCARGPRCRVPFTYGLLKPTIVLPADAGRWSNSKTRAVLAHELSHVKRKDNLTQLAARAICSLFWFVPFVWVAYSRVCLEQEQTCDAYVVHGGTRPTEYALLMVRFARRASEGILSAGIFIARGRVKMLEKRVTHVLYSVRTGKFLKGGIKIMTRAIMLSAALLLSVLVFPTSYAKEREFYASSSDEEVYGTWVNREYSGDMGWPQKIVYYPWGYVELYMRLENKNPVWPATSTLVDKWTDAEGNVWYRDYYRYQVGGVLYQLYRISDNGKTFESISRKREFPTEAEMNPSGPNYWIFYRQ